MTHISTTPLPHAVRCILFDVGNTLWEVSTNDESELLIPIEERLMATLQRHIPPRRWEQVDRKYVQQHFRQAMFKRMREYFITDPEHEPSVAHTVNATLQDFSFPPLDLTISQQIFEGKSLFNMHLTIVKKSEHTILSHGQTIRSISLAICLPFSPEYIHRETATAQAAL